MNDTETKMVKINLCWDANIGKPVADKEGNLSWERIDINPCSTDLTVRVPEEATKSKMDLLNYLQKSARDWDADILDFDERWTNIYDAEKKNYFFDLYFILNYCKERFITSLFLCEESKVLTHTMIN